MSYTLNKSNGTILIELIDGTIDTTTTDLSLIGRNSSGFGESINENFIKILENFANVSPPQQPLTGQLWFDETEGRIKVFDEVWKSAGGPSIQTDEPVNPIEGDLWYDEANKQLKVYDGSRFIVIGPNFSSNLGQTETVGDYIRNTQGINVSVLLTYVGGTLVGITSNQQFSINDVRFDNVLGLTTDLNNKKVVKQGFNPLSSDYKFQGTALNADGLNGVTANSFVRTDITSTIDANLIIRGGDGLTLGSVARFSPDAERNLVISQLSNNDDIFIRVIDTGTPKDAITIRATDNFIGLFNSTPDAMLHVGSTTSPGNVIIEGNLTVKGQTTTVSSTEVVVEDINIELGNTSNPTDLLANGGGITLKGSTDHYLKWFNSNTTKWELDDNLNLPDSKSFYIDDLEVLSETTLGSTVVNSSLTSVGTLTSLSVSGTTVLGDFTLTNSSIATDDSLIITADALVFNNPAQIKNVSSPTNANDAATKDYVDSIITNILGGAGSNVFTGDVKGSVYADDSKLIIDGVSGTINWDVLIETPTTLSGYGITDALPNNTNIEDLSNVSTSPPAVGQVLKWDGGNWAPSNDSTSVSSLNNIGDVNIVGTPTTGQVLKWNGTAWSLGEDENVLGLFTGDLKGSVFADDSSVIIDGVEGTIQAPRLVGALPAIDGSALTGITLTAADVGLGNVTNESKATMFTSPTFTGTVVLNGFTTLKATSEVVSSKSGASLTVAHDLEVEGSVFYHNSMNGDFTANFTNVPTTAGRTTSVALILSQGGTAYLPTAVQIGGAAQTINWQGGSVPSGTANGIDVVSFTLIRTPNTPVSWIVIGSATSYS